MSRHAFKRLGVELTKLFDDYETSAERPELFPTPTLGEHYFVYHAYRYLAAPDRPMSLGFARLLTVLTDQTHYDQWTRFDYRNGQVETNVLGNPEWNRFVRIAHAIMELEVYNTRVSKESKKLMIVLNLCTECGKVVVSDRGSVSYLCSSACRVSNNRGKYMDVNGQKPHGRATWVRWSKKLATYSAYSVLLRMERDVDPNELADVFGCGPGTDIEMESLAEGAFELFLNVGLSWSLDEDQPFRVFNIEDTQENLGLAKYLERDKKVARLVEALRKSYAKDPSGFRDDHNVILREQIRDLDPANSWGYAAGDEDTSVRSRRFTDIDTPSAVKYQAPNEEFGMVGVGYGGIIERDPDGELSPVHRHSNFSVNLKNLLDHTEDPEPEAVEVSAPTLEVRWDSGKDTGLVDLVRLSEAMDESTKDAIDQSEVNDTLAAYSDNLRFFEVYNAHNGKRIEREVLDLQPGNDERRLERMALMLRMVKQELERYTALKEIHAKELRHFHDQLQGSDPKAKAELMNSKQFWDVMRSVSAGESVGVSDDIKVEVKRGRPRGSRPKAKPDAK